MTKATLDELSKLYKIDLQPNQFTTVLEIIKNIGEQAYQEGFDHGKNEGYGQGWTAYAISKAIEPLNERNNKEFDKGWVKGYKDAAYDLTNGRPSQVENVFDDEEKTDNDEIPF